MNNGCLKNFGGSYSQTMTTNKTHVDHYVYATPNLLNTVARIAQATGVELEKGGVHDIGTANYLVALTKDGQRTGSYVEVIGVNPERTTPIDADNFGLRTLTTPGVATFCVPLGPDHFRAAIINQAAGTSRDVIAQSRLTPAGDTLSWSLIGPQPGKAVDLVPFSIDWGTTPHPSTTISVELELVAFEAHATSAASLTNVYEQLGLDVPVHEGSADSFTLTLSGPAGEITL